MLFLPAAHGSNTLGVQSWREISCIINQISVRHCVFEWTFVLRILLVLQFDLTQNEMEHLLHSLWLTSHFTACQTAHFTWDHVRGGGQMSSLTRSRFPLPCRKCAKLKTVRCLLLELPFKSRGGSWWGACPHDFSWILMWEKVFLHRQLVISQLPGWKSPRTPRYSTIFDSCTM